MRKHRAPCIEGKIYFRILGAPLGSVSGTCLFNGDVYELIGEVVNRRGVRRYVLRTVKHLFWVETVDVETVSKHAERVSESDVAKFLEERNIQRFWYDTPRWYRFHRYFGSEEQDSMPYEFGGYDDKAPKTFDVWKAIGEESRPPVWGHGGAVREIILEKYPSGEL